MDFPIVLASTSPRRVDLLQQAGIRFVAQAPVADETPLRGETARAMVSRLAREKAQSIVASVLREHGRGLIIGADTTVVLPNGSKSKILGKPESQEEAIRMVRSLVGRPHQVLTGYCLLMVARESPSQRLTRVVSSRVYMRKLSPELVGRYVSLGESMDKAGAYAVQGVGGTLIERVSGSYTNVVGLPMAQLLADLEKKFGVVQFPSL